MSLRPLLDLAAENERIHALASRVLAAADGGEGVTLRASATLRPLLLAALLEDDRGLAGRPALLVAADDRAARDLAADLRAFLAPRRVRFYPSRGTGYASSVTPPPHLVGLRIDALDALQREADAIVVASAVALAEAVPDASLRPAGSEIAKGDEIDLGAVAEDLVAAGYERAEQVEERGQFAVRGGILDVYPATEDRAVRIELFGDEVESMRWFSTFTQRSLGEAEVVELAPAAELDADHRELAALAAREAAESAKGEGTATDLGELLPLDQFRAPLDLVPDNAAVVLAAVEEVEPALRDVWEDAITSMKDEDARRLYVDVAGPLNARAALSLTAVSDDDEGETFRAARAESPARSIKEAESELEKLVRSGYRTVVAFDSMGEAERARYGLDRIEVRILEGGRLTPDPALTFAEARLREGFIAPELKLAVYPFRRLVHRRRRAEETPATGAGSRGRLAFSELRVGDYVVHEDHGVARFAGFETREIGGVTRDYLYLEYKGEDRVYVPTEQLAKLSRYVGAGGEPTLSALGGKRWQNLKARARKAAGALAGELLNLYAERKSRKGHAFAPDGEWQIDLALSDFPQEAVPIQPVTGAPDSSSSGGQTGGHGVLAGGQLVSGRLKRLGSRPDEHDPGRRARPGQPRVLRQEPVTGVNRVDPGRERRPDHRVHVQIAVGGRCGADPDDLVRQPGRERPHVRVRHGEHGLDAEPPAGPDHPDGNLPPVSHQHPPEPPRTTHAHAPFPVSSAAPTRLRISFDHRNPDKTDVKVVRNDRKMNGVVRTDSKMALGRG